METSEIRKKIIAIANEEIGTTEYPPNSNHTKYGQFFGFDGVAWCGIFCSYCYYHAGFPIKNGGFEKGFAGVGTAMINFKDKITKEPQMGDLVIFDWNADQKPDHVGLFVQWIDREKGMFETIEGNTSISNQSNGGQVLKRERNIRQVQAFINLIG
jgi:CHAP domain